MSRLAAAGGAPGRRPEQAAGAPVPWCGTSRLLAGWSSYQLRTLEGLCRQPNRVADLFAPDSRQAVLVRVPPPRGRASPAVSLPSPSPALLARPPELARDRRVCQALKPPELEGGPCLPLAARKTARCPPLWKRRWASHTGKRDMFVLSSGPSSGWPVARRAGGAPPAVSVCTSPVR